MTICPTDDPGAVLCELVRKVLHGYPVDLAVLRATAEVLLTDEYTGDEQLTAAIRRVAGAAFALATYDDADSLQELGNATRMFQMVWKLHQLDHL